ncbi:UvrD-helicase domain-containing protein [Rufibacter glacialis]|uniref:DNA 3'-5' helicase n=1 Tax=Rufibacter glacialis TaxID=1259555 RepID=A0A5M8Q9K1_9BACT|nr:UvrD-helicase domain-containing protein [Rufibacter glacialis]KAA6431813.1 AAA family ATPase [Rufibacter glacialis]GGK81366.1 ATP-dependent helicase [Rufibacter glacialis]
MPASFKIYSSSAGSGKTFQLTKEYLKLALQSEDVSYYKNILAITFTNDAAQEMKTRILGALRSFNEQGLQEKEKRKSDALLLNILNEIKDEYEQPNLTEAQLRVRAARVFDHLLFHYSEFAVSTIDSFVNRVVRAFTTELKLPHNFEVDMDAQTLLSTAVSLLLNKVNTQAENRLLAETLQQYALEKAEEGKSWNNLPEELAEFARHLLNEQTYEHLLDIGTLTLQDFKKIRQDLYAQKQTVEKQIQALAKEAADLIDQHHILPEEISYGKNGIYSYFRKWNASFDITTANSNAAKTVSDDKWPSGKASTGAKVSLDQIKGRLAEIYRAIEDLKERETQNHLLISAMLPHLYKLSVLSELERCIQEIKVDKNLVHISEFNKRITDIVLQEPIPFIYERLGERYQHILIDEFQDTSVLQWNNLLPLVENALAGDNFNMVVGDAKQAIYGWRGGEMEQILHLHRNQTHHLYQNSRFEENVAPRYDTLRWTLTPEHLNTNYRSAPEIITFNNELFGYISQANPQFPLLGAIYDENFAQKAPEGKATGLAHLQVLFTKEEDSPRKFDLDQCTRTEEVYAGYASEDLLSYQESTLQLVLQMVQQALADGYAPRDIAVLSRTNRNSKLVANFLKQKKFDIISQDSLSLQFAEVINLIIAFFRLLNQPANSLARSQALYLVYKVVHQELPDGATTARIAGLATTPSVDPFFGFLQQQGFDLAYRDAGNLSLYELTEKLIRVFDLLGKNNECEYLFRFLDLVLEYTLKYSNNLNNFLEYWDLHKEYLSINTPKDRDAITITSIHKSKGLDYPVVIVPFCDWSLEPQTSTLLWGTLPASISGDSKLRTAVVTLNKKLEQTALHQQYTQKLEKTFIENLNMLYVALTRPVDRLYLIAKAQDFKKGGAQKNVSYWLQQFLVNKGVWQEATLCYQLAKGPTQAVSHKPVTEEVYVLDKFTSADWAKNLKLKQHANNVFDFETQQEHRRWNRKLHYALARITYAQDMPKALRQLVHQGIISQRELPTLTQMVDHVVHHPQMQRYFNRSVTVENEREVLDVRTNRYKPDRIVFGETGDVTLIDYKLPPGKPEFVENLNSYAALFRELVFSKITCVVYYFEEDRVEEWEYTGEVAEQR